MVLRAAVAVMAASSVLLTGCTTYRSGPGSAALDQTLASHHRASENRARDVYRHPKETLMFFGAAPDMTIVEVWPGAGWYTEILAPLLRDQGQLYAAHLDPSSSEYARRTVDEFRTKLAGRPDLYDKVILTMLTAPPAKSALAPPGSADLVVTFRNMHNWMMFGWERAAFEAMHAALKPGGVLGVVEHRGNPQAPQDPKAASGYVNEQYAIDLIESVGFHLVARSNINANPKDTKDYEQGVWTLPPGYAAGATDRARYSQIGESDRFTLKFRKIAR